MWWIIGGFAILMTVVMYACLVVGSDADKGE